MQIHPLIPAALACAAGVYLAAWLDTPVWPPLAAGGGLALWLACRGARGHGLAVWALAACLFCLGAGLSAWERARPLPPDHLAHMADGGPRLIEVRVAAAPEPAEDGWTLICRALSAGGRPASGLVRLGWGRPEPPPPAGSLLTLEARLRLYVNYANPGAFDYARHMARQGFYLKSHVGKGTPLTVRAGTLAWPAGPVQAVRQRVGALIGGLPSGPAREFLRALILGQRGGLNPRVRESFAEVGAAHLLAISGLHLGLIWGLAYLVLRFLPLAWPAVLLRVNGPKLAALGALAAAAAYAALAGGSLPTLRALAMGAALVAALLADRPYRPAGGLALAALVIMLIWPQAPLTLSFQLSFLAVSVLLLAAGPLADRLRRAAPLGRVLGGLAGWLAVSALLAAALWPVTVLQFHQVPWLSVPANAVMIPLVGMAALPLGLAGAALGLVWPAGGGALMSMAAWPAAWAVELARWLASWPGAVSFLAGPGPLSAVLMYAAGLAALLLPGRWRWGLATGLLGAACLAWWAAAAPPRADGRLTAWVLDVGQGTSLAIRLPEGQTMVVDGGGLPGSAWDLGRNVVAPAWWRLRWPDPALIAVSHADPDHSGGLPFLVRALDPGALWTNGQAAAGGWYGRLLAQAAARGVPVLGPRDLPPRLHLGGAELLLAWPPQDLPPGVPVNDRSLWLGVSFGRTTLWLPGDAGPAVERLLADRLPAGGRQVLMAPHHGGVGSCTPELLARLAPEAVIFSAGCYNRFGMPRPEVLARVRAAGARAWSTKDWGALELVSDGDSWTVTPLLARPRSCLP